METKHTPGPWDVYCPEDESCTYGIEGSGGCAVVWFGENRGEGIRNIADARLIASAPEMLDALIDCRRALELANFTQELAVVDAAITKAIGHD